MKSITKNEIMLLSFARIYIEERNEKERKYTEEGIVFVDDEK